MALTKHDIALLKGMFHEQTQDIQRDIRDEMDARFIAFERRMQRSMDEKFVTFRQEIRSEFIDVLQTNILPVIDKAFQEIREVRRFVGMA